MILSAVVALALLPPLSGQALLDDLSQRAVQYFWTESYPTTGLSKDRASNLTSSDTYTVASIASTGYSLAAYAIGAKRGWLTKSAALARTQVTLNFLNSSSAAKQNGWFYHFIDWTTGARMWSSEVSDIDTSILISGMIVAEEYFQDPTVTSDVNSIIGAIDWNWMLTNGGANNSSVYFSLGWTPESGFIPYEWSNYDEETMLYIQALGAYSAMPSNSWASISRSVVTYDGVPELTAGPLFLHEESQEFIPYYGKRDSLGYDYTVEARNAVISDRQYCIDNPNHFAGYGPSLWGLSASDSPDGYSAYGIPNGPDDGTIDPAIGIGGVAFAPALSIALANNLYKTYPGAYGRFGFSNAICPAKNYIDNDAIGIDLGMMLLGIENHRDGFVNYMTSLSPMIQKGMARAGFHKTSEGPFQTRPLQVTGAG